MQKLKVLGHIVEFIPEEHIYLCDGIELPSITQMLRMKFANKYADIPDHMLKTAADKGNAVHKAIERYERFGEESELKELRNWKFLKKAYGFKCIDNEVPIILFDENEPIACGRLDLALEQDGKLGLGDIKRTSTLDKDYLAYQLNLYRLGYQQCYQQDVEFLRGIHLREDKRRYIDVPIKEEFIKDFIKEWRKENE